MKNRLSSYSHSRSVEPEAYGEPKSTHWYAVRVRSNFERMSALALEDRGCEHFLPTYRVRRRWSDRIKEVEVPLFGGYVFCRLDLHNRLPVLTAPGVIQILGQGQTPCPVPDSEIEAIRQVVSSNLPYSPAVGIGVGERVVVEWGPLAGVEGTLTAVKNHYRLLVSVHLLQRSVSVEVEAHCVRPIAQRWLQGPQGLIKPLMGKAANG